MAIGRSEDRDTPRNPTMLRHRVHVQGPDPRNPSGPAVDPTAHTGRTHDRNRPDPFKLPNLANRGPSTHGFRASPCGRSRNDIPGEAEPAAWIAPLRIVIQSERGVAL